MIDRAEFRFTDTKLAPYGIKLLERKLPRDPNSDWVICYGRNQFCSWHRLHHVPSGVVVYLINGELNRVEFNFSKQFTGEDNNLYVLQSQNEIDSAWANLLTIINPLIIGELKGHFSYLEFGCVCPRNYLDFHGILQHVNHPKKLKKTVHGREGITYGSKKSGNARVVSFYNKSLELNRKRKRGTKRFRGQLTRCEITLKNSKVRDTFGGAYPSSLNFNQCLDIFLSELQHLDVLHAKTPADASSIPQLIAMLKHRSSGLDPQAVGRVVGDFLASHRKASTVRRIERELAVCEAKTRGESLMAMLRPGIPLIDLGCPSLPPTS